MRLKGRSGCRGLRDCPPVPAHTDLDGTGVLPAAGPGGHPQARLYRAGAPAAAATSSGCRRLGQTIIWAPAPPPHNMSAEAAGEPRRTGPSTAGAAAAAGAGAAAEAGAALTVVSLQAGKEACRKLIPARFAPPEVSPPRSHPPSSTDFRVCSPPCPHEAGGRREPRCSRCSGCSARSFRPAFLRSGPRGACWPCAGLRGQKSHRGPRGGGALVVTTELPFPPSLHLGH